MFDSNRVFKKVPDKTIYDNLQSRKFIKLPILENLVELMNITCENPQHELIFKDCLKTALSKIRTVFIQSGLSKSKDFSDIYQSFFGGTDNFVKNSLKFSFRNIEEKGSYGYLDLETGNIHVDNTNVNDKEKTVTTLIHELIHYMTIMHNIKIYEETNDGVQKLVDKTYYDKTLYENEFFLEGYTELLNQMIFPPKSQYRSYKKQTGIAELLMFVSGKKYDFTNFLRMDMTHEREFLGDDLFMVFSNKCKEYQNLYNNSSSYANTHEKLEILYHEIQTVLVDKYIHDLIDKYRINKDFAYITKSISKLLEFIPVLKDEHVDKILDVENMLFKNQWNNNKDAYMLLKRYIEHKAKQTGKIFDFTYDNIPMSFTINKEKGVNLNLNYLDFDQDSMLKSYNKKMPNIYEKDSKTYTLRTLDQGYQLKVLNDDIVEKLIHIDYNETITGESYFTIQDKLKSNAPKKIVMIGVNEEPEEMEQNINFLQSIKQMKKIGQKFGIDCCRNVYKISSENKSTGLLGDNEIYFMDSNDDERYFFLKDGQGRMQQLYIENLLTEKNGKYALFTPILSTLDKKTNLDLLKTNNNIKSFKIYVLDNGMEVGEVVDVKDEVKYVVVNGKYMVEHQGNCIYDENNKELKKTWESILSEQIQR